MLMQSFYLVIYQILNKDNARERKWNNIRAKNIQEA